MMRLLLLSLQGFQVAILVLHDWVPIFPLNDVRAVRRGHSLLAMVLATIISSLLPSVGLSFSLYDWKSGWPNWLYVYLLGAYGFLFVGELEAWWIPYLARPQPKRAAQYEAMYAKTHAFLPPHNGIRLNTLHFLLHAATLITVFVLTFHFLAGA
jgi:hypothetical protein